MTRSRQFSMRVAGVVPTRPVGATRFRRAAFTLIELLVVVSIIALLISILLPTLKRARQQARAVLCLANIKGIASASLIYAGEDAHEQSIPVHPLADLGGDPGAYDWGGKAGRGESPTMNPSDSPWSTAQGRGPATRPLNRVLFKVSFTDYQNIPGTSQSNWANDQSLDLPAYRCPSDRGYTGHHYASWADSGLSSYDHYGTSYTSNTLWYPWISNTAGSYSPYLRSLSRIPHPQDTVYYLENCGRLGWHTKYGLQGGECPGLGSGMWSRVSRPASIKGWHGRPFQFATAFTDGHAGLIEMNGRSVPAPDFTTQHRTDRGFCFSGCHWIRGHGWRMDTHPGPRLLMPIAGQLAPLTHRIR